MKTRITALLVLFNFVFVSGIKAQNLKPEYGIFGAYGDLYDYYSKIRNKLLKDFSYDPALRLVVIPSFSSEYVLEIDQEALATVHVASQSIWHHKDTASIAVEKHAAQMEKNDVRLLAAVYRKMIEKSHYPVGHKMGLDGTTYHISVWDAGIKSGVIWSPDDSINKTVLDVTDHLIDDIIQGKKNVSLSEEHRTVLKKITDELGRGPDMQAYKLVIKIKEIVESNRQAYISKLCKTHVYYTNDLLAEFERELLLQFTFNGLDKQFVDGLISEYQRRFLSYVLYDVSKRDVEDVEAYKAMHQADNLFLKLTAELNEK